MRQVPPVTSLVLDIARFGLAFCVALAHWTQPYFQDDWPDLTPYAIAAVGGFFILSGYTIRLLTPSGQSFSGTSFFVERSSRLWSVALPALLFTVVLDLISYTFGREYYLKHWGIFTSYPALRVAANVGFISQCWGWDIKPFSNSPFWSLSYEAGFYALYGVYRVFVGWRRAAALGAVALLLGPNVILMLLVWLGGVALYDLTERVPRRRWALGPLLVGTSVVVAAVAWFAAGPAPSVASDLTARINEAFASAQATLRLPGALRLDPRRIDGWLILGAVGFWLVSAALLPLCRELDERIHVAKPVLRWGRAAGNFTFPLYLLHFPLFVMLGALNVYDRGSLLARLGWFVLVCAAIFAAMPLFDVFKVGLRRYLNEVIRRFQAHWPKHTGVKT